MRFREVRVIGAEGEQLGVMPSRNALAHAKEAGLDLVMVSPTAVPPVCKIIDFGRHKYLEGKQGKDKKKQTQELKGIKISPRIADHDIQTGLTKARKFLGEGDKVRFVCMFRARELSHPENGMKRLESIAEQLSDIAIVERAPSLDGRQMVMVLTPKPANAKKKDAKDQNQQNGGKAVQDHGDGSDNATEVAQQPPVPAQESVAETTP